jgi:hypothetical protein
MCNEFRALEASGRCDPFERAGEETLAESLPLKKFERNGWKRDRRCTLRPLSARLERIHLLDAGT